MARRRRRAQWLSAGCLFVSTMAAVAAPPVPAAAVRLPETAQPTAEDSGETRVPDAALLLYLSEFEDAGGEWIDPAELPAPDAAAVAEDDDDDDAP